MLLKPWASTLFLLGLTSPVASRSDRGLIDTLVASGASKFAAHIKSDPDVLQLFLSGQFQTLFAPDDTAFDDAALQARDLTPTQRQMLAFHAVRGETSLGIASRAIPGSVFETANESPLLGGRGQRIVTDTRPANVTVFTKRWNHQPDQRRETDAGSGPLLKITTGLGRATNVIKGDIEYDGGLIHITDSYFTLPQSLSSTSQVTGQVGFSGLLTDSDMGGALDATSSVTVFIPSNAAFAAAAAANATGAPAPELLSGHVVAGDVKYLPDLVDGSFLRAQTGEVLAVSVRDGIYYVNGARITQANLVIANGVAHVVDKT
ncbi:putative beta-ig-h3 fasciclin protein [Rosellinia necatrix]|uniref:Putative beta-ig-h3 fasciclin protein n=1 Tax=Rosellinia necatrix TaxID=77044 RepID=A0A1W2TEV3_ROSNE|nr:putative beta-ig-h3 fasciclin protein [Rosellinia necatrix]